MNLISLGQQCLSEGHNRMTRDELNRDPLNYGRP